MKKTITVKIDSSIERVRWTDHKATDEDEFRSRRPMTKVTETIRGEVEVELDLAEIVLDLAAQALHNKGPKASALSGKIRARVLTSHVDEKREPTQWAPGGKS